MAKFDSWATMNGATRTLDAQDARVGISALLTPGGSLVTARAGLRPGPGDPLRVAATATPGPNVTVQPGQLVLGASRGNGAYLTTTDTTDTLPILDVPAHASQQRNDLIVARQSDTYYGDSATAYTITRVVGTPGAGDPNPTAGGLSPDYVLLARIRVTAGATAITAAMVDDLRPGKTVALGGVLPIPTQAARDALPTYPGHTIWREDRKWTEVHDGTAWRVQGVAICTSTADRDSAITHPQSGQLAQTTNAGDVLWQYDGGSGLWVQVGGAWMPRGWIGESSNGAGAGDITSGTVVDTVLNKTLPAGRRIKVSWECSFDQVAPPYPTLGIGYQAGATITAAGMTVLRWWNIDSTNLSRPFGITGTWVVPATATYSFGSLAVGNGGTVHVYGRFLLVEDIGGS
ncbi:MAG: hypothetical protein ACRDSQ_29165 [Actinokineospora sp.]